MEETTKLPTTLALEVATQLKEKYGIDHWAKSLFDSNFTADELSKITNLEFNTPLSGSCTGIELLPNLQSLSVVSSNSGAYKPAKDIASISDEDVFSIEKCKNLTELRIVNQANISEIDLSGLPKLYNVNISNNNDLETINGIDKLPELSSLKCLGNKSLQEIKGLDKAIVQAEDLDTLNLDVLLFPKAIGYRPNGTYNQDAVDKMDELGKVKWSEAISGNRSVDINNYQMLKMHNKACSIMADNVPQVAGTRDTVMAVERYLAENVTYDDESLKHSRTKTTEMNNGIRLVTGIKDGTNSAFNCIMENSCVCEGYTRGEQYLLGLRGIKTHDVMCLSGADIMGMSDGKKADDLYATYNLPKDGYHSIVRIDDCYNLYSDPCWNAGHYQQGDKSMPYSLMTKEEISKTHTLSFEEKKISNNHAKVARVAISESLEHNTLFKNKKASEIAQQRMDTKPPVRGLVLKRGERVND